MNMFRDDDKDEDGDLQRFLENLTMFHLKGQSPYYRHYRCIDMLGHINEGENEQETTALISVFVIIF